MVRIMSRAVVTALLLPVLPLAACGHAAAPAPPPVTLSFCGNAPEPMPAVVQVVCNTGDITARNLVLARLGRASGHRPGYGGG